MLTTNRPIGCLVDSRMAIIKIPLHISVYREKINIIFNDRFIILLILLAKTFCKIDDKVSLDCVPQRLHNSELTPCIVIEEASGVCVYSAQWSSLYRMDIPDSLTSMACVWMLFRCDEAMAVVKWSLPLFRRADVNSQTTLNWLPTEEEKPGTLQRPNDCW